MLAILQAEEDLRAVHAVAAGTGSMRKQDQQAYLRSLQRRVRGPATAGPLTVGGLRAMGVRIREIPTRGTSPSPEAGRAS